MKLWVFFAVYMLALAIAGTGGWFLSSRPRVAAVLCASAAVLAFGALWWVSR